MERFRVLCRASRAALGWQQRQGVQFMLQYFPEIERKCGEKFHLGALGLKWAGRTATMASENLIKGRCGNEKDVYKRQD